MEFFRGRLIDHIHLRVRDLDASKRFYRAALEALRKADGIRESADHL
ncbi:MAG: VOC family protein, partial [Steroidobacter sp.]